MTSSRPDPGILLVRKAARERPRPPPRAIRWTASGTLAPETVLPLPRRADATGRHRIGCVGDYWLVPERQLCRVPPRSSLDDARGATSPGS